MKRAILTTAGIILGVATLSFIYAHSEKVEEVNKINKCSNLFRR